MIYVEVAIAKQHTSRKFYTYHYLESLDIGQIVKIEYGHKMVYGVIVTVVKKPTFTTKKILNIIPYKLPKTYVQLLLWMYNFYPDDWGSITQLFLPSNFLNKKTSDKPQIIVGVENKLPKANQEQSIALNKIYETSNRRVLLHGDTGSGKTRVFLEIAKHYINENKSVLILTPEIGLTPQLVKDIANYVKAPILLTHSAINQPERRNIWQYASTSSAANIYVGPRSAIFLPITNLGLIIVDEAHDDSYKQSQPPKYQTLHVVSKLAELSHSMLIFSTATPNIQDYFLAQKKGYTVIRMLAKAAGEHKHTVELIDITEREKFNQSSYLADQLIEDMRQCLKNNEQIMLFLNRRGSARLIQCEDCGWQAMCPKCSVPVTYHHDNFLMRCHLCGFSQAAITHCPECKSLNIHYKNIGTKALVEHVQNLFPLAKIFRFDADSVSSEKLYNNIDILKNKKIDIIIGTQIISKGIDLPKLGLVGVINADSGLNLPDYRAEEITFGQLYQVTGRAARGHRLNKSIVQTRIPTHPVMQAILAQNWNNFYDFELAKRKQFVYPPFCYIAEFKITRKSLAAAERDCQNLYNILSSKYKNKLVLLGPSPSFYAQKDGQFCWQIIIKSNSRSLLVKIARELPAKWTYNIDPTSLL